MQASTPDPGPAGVDLRIAPDSETMSQAAAAEIGARIRAAGFKAVRRNVRYDWLGEPG